MKVNEVAWSINLFYGLQEVQLRSKIRLFELEPCFTIKIRVIVACDKLLLVVEIRISKSCVSLWNRTHIWQLISQNSHYHIFIVLNIPTFQTIRETITFFAVLSLGATIMATPLAYFSKKLTVCTSKIICTINSIKWF